MIEVGGTDSAAAPQIIRLTATDAVNLAGNAQSGPPIGALWAIELKSGARPWRNQPQRSPSHTQKTIRSPALDERRTTLRIREFKCDLISGRSECSPETSRFFRRWWTWIDRSDVELERVVPHQGCIEGHSSVARKQQAFGHFVFPLARETRCSNDPTSRHRQADEEFRTVPAARPVWSGPSGRRY